jgi:hypothetical protein
MDSDLLEVEASHTLVVKDLTLLHNSSVHLQEIVGSPDPFLPQTLPLVAGVCELSDEVKSIILSQSETQGSVELVLKEQQDFHQTIIGTIEENESKITVAAQEFKK